jgi:hypothetical protein
VRAVATTLLAQLVSASLKKKMYRECNNVRVLAIHLTSTITVAANNKANLHPSVSIQVHALFH